MRANGYYITRTPRFTRANGWKQVFLDYADKFSDGTSAPVNYNTFAYPTKVTDPDGFESKAEYRFDFGAPVKAQGPPPAGQSVGAIVRRVYDSIGRLERVKTEFNGVQDYSYTRWTYPSTNEKVNQYTTITDGAGEAYSYTQTDGLGHTLKSVTDHPGSHGLYSTVATEYDNLGRPWKQSVPTETNDQTVPNLDGDDPGGYLYRTQTYDWKGRPLVSTNTDGTVTEASYGGCGCAGGEVVTILGENLASGATPKRRKQMVYSDFLGRPVKTESYNWPAPYGDGAVYNSTVSEYNARDQVTFVKQYAGAATADGTCPTGTCQQSEPQYDGHGRQKQVHTPEMDNNAWQSVTYNANDTVATATDGRGATTAYTYNARRLVTNISYAAAAGITATPSVGYIYDAAGNRTQMTDGLGSVTYTYDALSRLTAEKRQLTGLINPSQTDGAYAISYNHTRGGQLQSVTDPFNAQVGYSYDGAGRLSTVTGAGFGNVTQYASQLQYRAWGALKGETYGNGRTLTASYNARLQPAQYTVNGVISLTYQYLADGATSFVHDTLDARFDRAYTYDQAARLTQALSGAEASGGGPTNNRPYQQSYAYDAWSNLTARSGKHWSHTTPTHGPVMFSNNRNPYWQYDADGRTTLASGNLASTFDAAGRLVQTTGPARRNNPPLTLQQTFDGDGQRVKKTEYGVTTYLLRASALGGRVVAELYGTPGAGNLGQKAKGHVYSPGGPELAEQNTYLNIAFYQHHAPHGVKHGNSANYPDGLQAYSWTELDPAGADVGDEDPYDTGGGGGGLALLGYPFHSDPNDYATGCTVDGQPWPCTLAFEYKREVQRGGGQVLTTTGGGSFGELNLRRGITPDVSSGQALWVTDSDYTTDELGYDAEAGWYPLPTVHAGGGHFEFVPGGASLATAIQEKPKQQPKGTFPGGSPNPLAQLGPCAELVVPSSVDLAKVNPAAFNFLAGTYVEEVAAQVYDSFTTYEKAVFLNSVSAATSLGSNLTNAVFYDFHLSDKPGNLPFGIYYGGVISGVNSGRHGKIASVEFTHDSKGKYWDVDLYKGTFFSYVFGPHGKEGDFNETYNRPTHPGDVTRQLAARGVNSGVSCKN